MLASACLSCARPADDGPCAQRQASKQASKGLPERIRSREHNTHQDVLTSQLRVDKTLIYFTEHHMNLGLLGPSLSMEGVDQGEGGTEGFLP